MKTMGRIFSLLTQKKQTKIKEAPSLIMILLSSFCEIFKKDIEKCRAAIKLIINGGQSPNTRETETDIRQLKNKAGFLLYC